MAVLLAKMGIRCDELQAAYALITFLIIMLVVVELHFMQSKKTPHSAMATLTIYGVASTILELQNPTSS